MLKQRLQKIDHLIQMVDAAYQTDTEEDEPDIDE